MEEVVVTLDGVTFQSMGKSRLALVTFRVFDGVNKPPKFGQFSIEIPVFVLNNDEAGIFARARKQLHEVIQALATQTTP